MLRLLRLATALAVTLAVCSLDAWAQSLDASQHRTCAVSAEGQLYCWGALDWGDGRSIPVDAGSISPIPVAAGERVTSVATGWLHDCARFASGGVSCAGLNYSGELGRGRKASCPNDEPDGSCGGTGGPGVAPGPRAFRTVVSGQSHSCALTTDGAAYCWGSNDAGQTGVGSRVKAVYEPTAVVGRRRFRQLSAGARHTCGVTVAGAVYCWGAGSHGQLGSNPTRRGCRLSDACMAVPVRLDERRVFAQVSAGSEHSCAATHAGRVYCWGRYYSEARGAEPQPLVHVRSTFSFRTVSAGLDFTCGVSDAGRAYCWAAPGAYLAALGRDLAAWGCSPGSACLDETPVTRGIRFRSVVAGDLHACGIGRSGRVYCWGVRDVSTVGRARTQAEQPPLCRRVRPGSDSRCADEPFEIPVPNLLLTDPR